MNSKSKVHFYLGIFIFIEILFFMHVSLWKDESFTMSLVHNDYLNIINIDSMDVHPPLYYLILKAFLNITTFWSDSFFVKVIFARLFSLITTAMSLLILNKTMRKMDVCFNQSTLMILFLLMPNILLYATQIRMYSLATLFIVLEFDQLIRYYKSQKSGNLILSILFAAFAAYTHYFAAVSAGFLLVLYCFKFIMIKNFVTAKTIAKSILVFLGLFIPWLFVAISQVKRVNDDYWIKSSGWNGLLKSFFGIYNCIYVALWSSIILWICLAIIVFCSMRNLNRYFKNSILTIFCVYSLTFGFGMLVSYLTRPIFVSRYIYPVYFILIYLTVVCLMKLCSNGFFNNNLIPKLLFVGVVFLILSVNHTVTIFNQINRYVIPSISFVKEAKEMQQNKNQTIKLSSRFSTDHLTERIVYLQYINKNVTNNDIRVGRLFGNNNQKLFKKIFYNVN
ncbi:hypothetical protein [Apilactobacillus xinyiensis]|uniref:hypothetical protein n=1 Tax=Apilactobacillus xinyiensis TaxID=2841032 RepID=UPI00200DAE83|nr:hypothetical protein [Apilactobacillus xinyiensis]MCL0330237.1 hypothetical protein [Apilactobacillus xinyiensis]